MILFCLLTPLTDSPIILHSSLKIMWKKCIRILITQKSLLTQIYKFYCLYVSTHQKTTDENFTHRKAKSCMNKFYTFVKMLGYVRLGQIRATKSFIANAFFCVAFGIHIDIIFSGIYHMGHSDAS